MNTKTVIAITGGSHGIGREAALQLASNGSHVVILAAGRSQGEIEEAERSLAAVRSANPSHRGSLILADLSTIKGAKHAAEEIRNKIQEIDVLINNAAVFGLRRIKRTTDGLEYTFSLNYLASYILSLELLNSGTLRNGGRIVNITSRAYRQTKVPIASFNCEQSYNFKQAYALSKMCVVLFTQTLARHISERNISVNCLHPGLVYTGIGNRAGMLYNILLRYRARGKSRSVADAASDYVHLATSPDVDNVSGYCFSEQSALDLTDLPAKQGDAEYLWDLSERLTGIKLAPAK